MNISNTYIRLLDTPAVIIQGESKLLQLRYRKALGLLAYLVAERNRNHSRAFLASLFWPDFDEPTARLNLRQSLASLNKFFDQLDAPYTLNVNREFIALNSQTHIAFDVHDLEQFDPIEVSVSNESLLTGVFLPGFSLADCDEFESWIEDKRNYYRNCQIRLLTHLLSQAQTKHRSDQVIDLTTKLLQIDPDNEALLCEAMRLCADFGQPQLSLKLYEHFSQRLERDIGVSPNATSQALYKQILELSQASVTIPSHANQFPAVEKISPVVIVHLQWKCHLQDAEAMAQSLYDADHYARKILCSEMNAFHLSNAGRGAFFYFGWPKALDDNAWMAIRGVLRLMHYANAHADLDLRAALHTGTLLSSIKASIPDLLGDITEETSLLCQSANNGQALISEHCYQLVRKRVKAHRLIEHRRRIDGNIQNSYLLVDVHDWLDDEVLFFHSKMKQYLATLDNIYEEVIVSKTPTLAYTVSPAGSGKSAQVNTWLTGKLNQHTLIKLQCYPDRQDYAFFPLIACLRQLLGLKPDQVISTQSLADQLNSTDWHQSPDSSQLAELLSSTSAPSRQKIDLILEDFYELFSNFVSFQPLVFWVEDGHWIDELTFYFLEQIPSKIKRSIMVIMTARQLPYTGQFRRWKNIPLLKQGVIDATQMLRFFKYPKQLTLEQIDEVLLLSEHNPYLMLCLDHTNPEQIPLRVQHYYSFAIDQTGSLRDQSLHQAIQKTPLKEKAISASQLLARTLISLTAPTRLMHIHRSLAEDISKKRKSKAKDFRKLSQLAEHWFHSHEYKQSAELFKQCAYQAMKLHDYRLATKHFKQLLKLHTLIKPAEQEQVDHLIDYASCRIQAYGYTDKEALNAISEALSLSQQLKDNYRLFKCLSLTLLSTEGHGKADVKLQCANLLSQLAVNDEERSIAHWAMAYGYLIERTYNQSKLHAEKALKILSNQPNLQTYTLLTENLKINCLAIMGHCCYLDNNVDKTMECIYDLIDIDANTKSVQISEYDRCRALFFAAFLASRCNNDDLAFKLAQQCMQIAKGLKQVIWYSLARLVELKSSQQNDVTIDSNELSWLLSNIETGFSDILPVAFSLTSELVTLNLTQHDAIHQLTTKLHSISEPMNDNQSSLIQDLLKQ